MAGTAGAGASAGAAGGAGTAGGGGTQTAPGNARLPPIGDPGDAGPFEIQVVETLAGLATHILIAPRDLGRDGLVHPVLVWINGAGANSSSYRNMHDNLAAQGFVIVDDKQSTFEAIPEIDSQRAAIDWVIAQAQDPSSPYQGKFDATRIAIGGHSLGSVASFGTWPTRASRPRCTWLVASPAIPAASTTH
jgi:alpha-beta hydrolase superfamily lysophospholipase